MTNFTRLVRQGNSTGITLSREVLDQAGLQRGDEVAVTVRDGRIEICRAEPEYRRAMQALRGASRRYPVTMAKLAK